MEQHQLTEALLDLAQRAVEARVVKLDDGRTYLVTPDGVKTQDVTDPNGLTPGVPARIAQRVTLQTVDSLVDYADRFKQSASVLFADIGQNSMTATLDYHGESDGRAPGEAGNVDHIATMTLPFSEEWKVWTAISGKMMPQLEFARFIEENAPDVAAPSGAELLDVVRDLHALRKVDFKKAVRTSSDNESFEYTDETSAVTRNGALEIPTQFKLSVPVYFNGRSTELFAFLRWRLDDGAILLGVALHRAEHVRQAMFKEIVDDVAGRTSLPAVFGKLA